MYQPRTHTVALVEGDEVPQPAVGFPRLSPHAIGRLSVEITVRVGHRQNVPSGGQWTSYWNQRYIEDFWTNQLEKLEAAKAA